MTDPTVAPRPKWASGIGARCGWMNGRREVCSAWARVCGSRMLPQLNSLGWSFSMNRCFPNHAL